MSFWGYDSAIEVVFIVDVLALKKLSPKMKDAEQGVLEAFDSETIRIHEAAEKVYRGASSKSYSCHLTAKDF